MKTNDANFSLTSENNSDSNNDVGDLMKRFDEEERKSSQSWRHMFSNHATVGDTDELSIFDLNSVFFCLGLYRKTDRLSSSTLKRNASTVLVQSVLVARRLNNEKTSSKLVLKQPVNSYDYRLWNAADTRSTETKI